MKAKKVLAIISTAVLCVTLSATAFFMPASAGTKHASDTAEIGPNWWPQPTGAAWELTADNYLKYTGTGEGAIVNGQAGGSMDPAKKLVMEYEVDISATTAMNGFYLYTNAPTNLYSDLHMQYSKNSVIFFDMKNGGNKAGFVASGDGPVNAAMFKTGAGEFNKVVITVDNKKLTVTINGQTLIADYDISSTITAAGFIGLTSAGPNAVFRNVKTTYDNGAPVYGFLAADYVVETPSTTTSTTESTGEASTTETTSDSATETAKDTTTETTTGETEPPAKVSDLEKIWFVNNGSTFIQQQNNELVSDKLGGPNSDISGIHYKDALKDFEMDFEVKLPSDMALVTAEKPQYVDIGIGYSLLNDTVPAAGETILRIGYSDIARDGQTKIDKRLVARLYQKDGDKFTTEGEVELACATDLGGGWYGFKVIVKNGELKLYSRVSKSNYVIEYTRSNLKNYQEGYLGLFATGFKPSYRTIVVKPASGDSVAAFVNSGATYKSATGNANVAPYLFAQTVPGDAAKGWAMDKATGVLSATELNAKKQASFALDSPAGFFAPGVAGTQMKDYTLSFDVLLPENEEGTINNFFDFIPRAKNQQIFIRAARNFSHIYDLGQDGAGPLNAVDLELNGGYQNIKIVIAGDKATVYLNGEVLHEISGLSQNEGFFPWFSGQGYKPSIKNVLITTNGTDGKAYNTELFSTAKPLAYTYEGQEGGDKPSTGENSTPLYVMFALGAVSLLAAAFTLYSVKKSKSL